MVTYKNVEEFNYVVSFIKDIVSKFSNKSLSIEEILSKTREPAFNEKLLKVTLNNPKELYLELKNHVGFINTVGSTLIKAYSVTELLTGVDVALVDPYVLVKELKSIHPFMERYNPLVITYLYVKFRDVYTKLIYEPIRDKTTLYEFNPTPENLFVFRDYFMHTSIGVAESMNKLYGSFIGEFGKALSNINIGEQYVLTGFRSYLRVVKGLLESLNALLHAYSRSRYVEDNVRSLYDSKILTQLYLYHVESRKTFTSNIWRIINMVKSVMGAEDRVVRESIILAIKHQLRNNWLFEKTLYDVLCFIYTSSILMNSLAVLKDIDYEVSRSIEETVFTFESALNEIISDKETYLEQVAKLLSTNNEPYLSFRNKLIGVKGCLPSWLAKLL